MLAPVLHSAQHADMHSLLELIALHGRSEVAKQAGVERTTLWAVASGRRMLSAALADALEAAFPSFDRARSLLEADRALRARRSGATPTVEVEP